MTRSVSGDRFSAASPSVDQDYLPPNLRVRRLWRRGSFSCLCPDGELKTKLVDRDGSSTEAIGLIWRGNNVDGYTVPEAFRRTKKTQGVAT